MDERTIDCESERDVLLNLGIIEIVVLRCNNSKPGDDDDDSPEPSDLRPHPRAKEYWKNWEYDQNRNLQKKGKRITPTTHKDYTKKPIYESHLKGRDLRHRVTTEKEFAVQRRIKEKTIEYLDSFENPYCILVLKYRSRGSSINIYWLLRPHS